MAKKKGTGMALNLSRRQRWLAMSIAAVLLLIAIPLGISHFSGNDSPTGTSATASPTTATNISVEWKDKADYENTFSSQDEQEITQAVSQALLESSKKDTSSMNYGDVIFVIQSAQRVGEWGTISIAWTKKGENFFGADPFEILLKKENGKWKAIREESGSYCSLAKQIPEQLVNSFALVNLGCSQ